MVVIIIPYLSGVTLDLGIIIRINFDKYLINYKLYYIQILLTSLKTYRVFSNLLNFIKINLIILSIYTIKYN